MASFKNNMGAPLSLCFDLDGTLIETAPDLIRVLNTVIAEDGLPETDYARARRDVGYGSKKLIAAAFARANRTITDERLETLRTMFLELYAEDIARLSHPFPGVIQTLCRLKAEGAELSVCTNKAGYLARPLLETLGMTSLFARIIGSDDVQFHKPSPEHIYAAVGHRRRKRIVMIGDSKPDIHAAKAAKIPSIAMAYGYSSIPVEKLGADSVLRSFRDIPSALNDILS